MRRFSAVIIFLYFIAPIKAQQIQNLDNRYQLAQSYEQAGQLEKAETIYRELSEIQPWNTIYFESLNKILVSQKRYDHSIELLNNKIKQTPADFNLYGMLGSTYFVMDQTEKASETWEKGVAINPGSVIGYRVIANYALMNRAFETAIDLLQRGKKYSDDPTIFSIDLANIYSANMKFKEAASEFCNLILLHPEQAQVAKARINIYLKGHGAIEQTVDAIKNFIDSNSQIALYDLLTFVYQASGNYKAALENVIKTEELFRGDGSRIFVFAQESYRNRQYEWASNGFAYIMKNYGNSNFVSTAKIGNARALEASLDQKFLEQNDSWKPSSKLVPIFTDEYNKIIKDYNEFANEFSDNAVKIEAQFRIAEIYRKRVINYQKADSIYNQISLLSQMSRYYIESNISRGIIAISNNDLQSAQNLFRSAATSQRIEPNDLANINFHLARIEFWNGNFTASLNLLNEISKNLSTDFSNDALELSALINTAKKDSLILLKYAEADLLAIQNKHKEAGVEFKTLSDNPNVFIINDFAKNKFAEMLIAENDFLEAIKVLEEAIESPNNSIFVEKSIFLLARCYQYGIKDLQKAAKTYQKLLETFPNSLYFDHAREALQGLSTKNG